MASSPEQVATKRQQSGAALADATAAVAADAWASVEPGSIARSWTAQLPRLTVAVSGAQVAAASDADDYLDEVLGAQDLDPAAVGRVVPRAFGGIASDGRALASLLYQPAVTSLLAIGSGAPVPRALAGGAATLDMIVRTQVADAGRAATSVATTTRPVATGYTRQLTPPSCSRCAVLAGRFYRWNQGFLRHPRCDCVHVPGRLETVGRTALSPDAYFASLTGEEQDRVFTAAGAEAIRDGADISQVVNARRGMSTTVIGGQRVRTTTISTGRRGIVPGKVRLMPEEIYRIAGNDRGEAIRLLRSNGYLFGTSAPAAI